MPKEVSAGGLTLHLRRRELLHPGPLRYESLIQAACHTIPYSGIALALIGTLLYFRRQLQDARAATELNLHLQFVAAWESNQISGARSRASAARLRNHDPTPYDIETILDNLEGMAYHANRNNINLDLVSNDFGYAVRCYWHVLSLYVITQRGVRSDRTLFTEVEVLYKRGQGTERLYGAEVTPGTFEFFGMQAVKDFSDFARNSILALLFPPLVLISQCRIQRRYYHAQQKT